MILGVSADAEMHEIKQVAQRSLMELRLGGADDTTAIRRIENALETLQDPVERFQWGLFWPELTAGEAESFRTDPVLSTLADNQCHDAAAAYERISESDSIEVRSHNIGVLALLRAVAATEEAQKGTPDDIEDDLECVQIWHEAFRHFRLVIGSDKFWMRQKLRAKALGDARLDGTRIAEIRNGLLAEILSPTGDVITTALLDGHTEVAKAYVDLLRTSDFEEAFIEKTLSNVYKPLADRVERGINSLEERLKGAQEQDEEGVFQEVLEAFKTGALHDLNVMLAVGDLPGYAEEHARDTAAEFLRSLAIASWNKAGEANVSNEALQLAIRFADADSLKSRVRDDFSTFTRLAKQRTHFKKLRPLYDSLQRVLDRGRKKEALDIIDKMIAASSGEELANLKRLRKTVSSSIATDLYNWAIQRAKSQKFQAAHELLEEALEYETDSGERLLIEIAQGQIPKSSTGCLASLLVLLAVAVLGGFAGGTLYADIL